jgi:hypothetical protein
MEDDAILRFDRRPGQCARTSERGRTSRVATDDEYPCICKLYALNRVSTNINVNVNDRDLREAKETVKRNVQK